VLRDALQLFDRRRIIHDLLVKTAQASCQGR
jgi:hypothetical protein